jgi:hypothetical protein
MNIHGKDIYKDRHWGQERKGLITFSTIHYVANALLLPSPQIRIGVPHLQSNTPELASKGVRLATYIQNDKRY